MAVLGIANTGLGQSEYRLEGYVYNQVGSERIDGASVYIENINAPEHSYDTTTNYDGYFSISLPEGSYKISVDADGYNIENHDNIYINGDHTESFYLIAEYNDGFDGGDYYPYDGSDGYDGFDGFDGDDGDDGDDGEDGDGGGENMGEILPAGMQDSLSLYASVCLIFIIVLFVSFIIMACASLGMFVRLGKIKKDMRKLRETQEYQQNQQYRQQQDYRPDYPRPREREPPARQAPPPPPTQANASSERNNNHRAKDVTCHRCGVENREDERYCRKCDAPL
jgi:hypothetical protein